MEAALEIIGYLCDVRHVDILDSVVVPLPGELKIDFLREEELQEELHEFRVLFLLEVLVREHEHASADQQLPPTLVVLVDCAHGPVARVSQRATG